MKKLIICLISLCFLIGCANTKNRQFKESLSQTIGHMTYDEALIRWGEPISFTEGTDIFIAVWGESREVTMHMPKGPYNPAYSISRLRGDKWEGTFDKKTKVVIRWKTNF